MEIYIAAFGFVGGTVLIDENPFSVNGKKDPISVGTADDFGRILIKPENGKFGDSEDNFIYVYTHIDPAAENFELSGDFRIRMSEGNTPGRQAGYGLLAADTAAGGEQVRRYRNYIAVGRFRMNSAFSTGCGTRVISGYRNADAVEFQAVRKIDTTRTARNIRHDSEITDGESYSFLLRKTDEGFSAEVSASGETEHFFFPGCDFLMQQKPDSICAGFAAAGAFELSVSNIHFFKSGGSVSHTPEEEIHSAIPDYPFSRYDVPGCGGSPSGLTTGDIYTAPDGEPDRHGTEKEPVDLQTALNSARSGQRIILMDGIYKPAQPYMITRKMDGAHPVSVLPQHDKQAVLDGSAMEKDLPIIILRGENWRLHGLIVQNSPSAGIFICGNHNTAERCETRKNRDTGLLICAFPGAPEQDRPAYNEILCCDSHDNCDPDRNNADGFGAKLSVGEGNRFSECIAHHNIDDGFDLYTKSIIGPISPVLIENCIAYENGHLSDQEIITNMGGNGFKLGGENQPVPHIVKNCTAYNNYGVGFTSNSNPAGIYEHLFSWGNGDNPFRHNYNFSSENLSAGFGWKFSDLEPKETVFIQHSRFSQSVPRFTAQKEAVYADLVRRHGTEFISCDTAVTPVRKGDGTINRRGLFEPVEKPAAPPEQTVPLTSAPKKIMFIIPKLSGGGAEKIIAEVASAIAENHTVHIVLTSGKDPRTAYPVSEKVHIIDLNDYRNAAETSEPRPLSAGAEKRQVKITLILRKTLENIRKIFKKAFWKSTQYTLSILHRILPGKAFARLRAYFFLIFYPENKDFRREIEIVRKLKKELGIECSVSFLNTSNYINTESSTGEYEIISIRSCLSGPFAPPEVKPWPGKKMVIESCRKADKIAAVSKETAVDLTDNWGVRERKISIIYNFLDPDRIRKLRCELIEDPNTIAVLNSAKFVFFANGRLTIKKGHWHLIRAFKRVLDTHPGTVLMILGHPGLPEEDTSELLNQIISVNHLENNVFLLGFHLNPYKYMGTGDAFVHTSFNEGFPNALLDALALGLPIISTDCKSGPREIIAPGTDCVKKTRSAEYAEYGILVPECSGKELISEPLEGEELLLAETMSKLIDDPALRGHYSQKSLERAAHFDKKDLIRKWEEIITEFPGK